MTRHSFYHRVKLSHPSLLFRVDCLSLLLRNQALSRIHTFGINFAPPSLLSSEYLSMPRLYPAKHSTLAGFVCGRPICLAPITGETREQSKEFKTIKELLMTVVPPAYSVSPYLPRKNDCIFEEIEGFLSIDYPVSTVTHITFCECAHDAPRASSAQRKESVMRFSKYL